MLEIERVVGCLSACGGQPADVVRDRLTAELRRHGAGQPLADDVTILVVTRLAPAG